MIKVFLVEDEFVVREGIKKNIDWESHGYQFCGEASDGELAFPLIKKEMPDIVITDIRMPFMDGLELSKLIKKEMPWVEIIILTGFEEFEYAKEGIKIGVARYLSKPISGDDLISELNALSEKIEQNKKEREIKEKYLNEMKEDTINEKKLFFEKLVTGSDSAAELIEMGEKLSVKLSSLWYNVVLIKIEASTHSHEEFSERLVKIDLKTEEILDDEYVNMFDRDLEGKAFIFKADTKENLEKITSDYIGKLINIFNEFEGIKYFGGIGIPADKMRDIPKSFETANQAYTRRFFTKESCFVNSSDLSTSDVSINDEFNIEDLDIKQFDRSKIREFLKLGDGAETEYFIEEFLRGNNNAVKSQIFRQYLIMDFYFCVSEFIESLGVSKEDAGLSEYKPDITRTENEAREYFISIINKGIEIREKNITGHNNDIIDDVKKYIDDNYADDELSLNSIASHVNFSPNHLSMVFSQQTGSTFIKYLTDYRMNKAKELLKCTNKRSSEISILVGYKDPHYFSYLFKKTQGMTPTQFRGGKISEED
ncbi:MAG: response regulator [Lachnospiraceae bacterium]|nr:response regulator [Lachnospiraceae bacterium]